MKKIFFTVIAVAAIYHLQAQATANNELKGLINQSFSYFPRIKEVENTVETAKQRLQTELPRLAIKAGAGTASPEAVPGEQQTVPPSPEGRTTTLRRVELNPSALSRSVPAAAGSEPSWNVYGGERLNRMMVFSKQ